MKSIITADIFISGLPYLITNFFQGLLEEFFPLGKSLFAAENLLLSYLHPVRQRGGSGFIAVSLTEAHCLSPHLVLCLFP